MANENEVLKSYSENIYKPIEETVLFRPVSRRIAKLLKNTPVSPLFFNFLSLATYLTAGLSYIYVSSAIISALLLYLGFLFDKIDGDLARAKGVAGARGQYIDGLLDLYADAFLTAFIAVGISFSNPILIALAVAGPLVFYYHGIAVPFYLNKIASIHRLQNVNNKWQMFFKNLFSYGRAKHILFIIFCTLIGKVEIIFYVFPFLLLYTFILFLKHLISHDRSPSNS